MRWNGDKKNTVDPLRYLDKVELVSNALSHTIKSGDTFRDIAKAYGSSVSELERVNPSVNIKVLKIGTKLNLGKRGTVTPVISLFAKSPS